VVGIPGIRIMESHEHYDRQHQDLRTELDRKIVLTPLAEEYGFTESDIEKHFREAVFGREVQRLPRSGSKNTEVETLSISMQQYRDSVAGTKIKSRDGRTVSLDKVASFSEFGHPYGDTMDGVDADYAAKLTGLNAITLAGMAGAPPFPMNVEASGAVQPSAMLTWERPKGKAARNLAGYRVHWRETTAPEWTHSRYVGDVTEWEFKNLVIDNYFFGVSAVSKEGYETPVVFPGMAGRF